MEEKIIDRIIAIRSMFLNNTGTNILGESGILEKLSNALTDKDINEIKDNKIYFNPVYFPGSQSILNNTIEKHSTIITIDLNAIDLFNKEEMCAIILHEIGHALNPTIKGEEGEYTADNYAISRGYKDFIMSSLKLGIKVLPKVYDKEITNKRLDKININTSI